MSGFGDGLFGDGLFGEGSTTSAATLTMIAPRYRVLVDWGGANSVLRVGLGHVGGPETITAGSASDVFNGVYDSPYSDVAADATAGKVQRKMGTDGVCEGTLDLTLSDSWPGKYNAKNPDSPLYGLIRPCIRGQVDVSFDGGTTWETIYGGWLSETESEPDYGAGQARLSFTDLAFLDRPVAAIASTGPTTVAAALDLVHDAIGWTGSRDFRSDSQLADFSTDGDQTARQIVAQLIKVDLGYYYVSKSNVATYVDKYEYARRASSSTFEAMGASVPGVSLKTIVNGATATGPSGAAQTYEDAESRNKFGPLDDPSGDVSSDWFEDDAAALSNAKWRVITQKDPVGAYWQFQPVPRDDATFVSAVAAEMLDVVTVEPVGLPAEDQQAQWITHDFGGGRAHTVTWRLRELPLLKPAIVGLATVGGSDVVAV